MATCGLILGSVVKGFLVREATTPGFDSCLGNFILARRKDSPESGLRKYQVSMHEENPSLPIMNKPHHPYDIGVTTERNIVFP